jgi:hypothetical protein
MILKPGTWPALELLKALAIASMVFIHTWGTSVTDLDVDFYKQSWAFQLGNIIHFFCFFNIWIPAIAGSTLRLQVKDINIETNLKRVLAKIALKWGVILILAGFVFSWMVDRLETFLWYDPLHFMGFVFLLISFLLITVGPKGILICSTLMYVASYFTVKLQSLYVSSAPYRIYDQPGIEKNIQIKNYVLEILFGSSRIGWSFFPWTVSILGGFSFAHYLLQSRKPKKLLVQIGIISFGVIVFCLYSPGSIEFIRNQNMTDQYTSLAMPFKLFTAVTSGYLFFLSLATIFYPKKGLGSISQIVSSLSRGSFWIFFIEFPLILAFKPSFEFRSFPVRAILFPFFMLLWSIVIGALAVEIGKKKLVINLVKSEKKN